MWYEFDSIRANCYFILYFSLCSMTFIVAVLIDFIAHQLLIGNWQIANRLATTNENFPVCWKVGLFHSTITAAIAVLAFNCYIWSARVRDDIMRSALNEIDRMNDLINTTNECHEWPTSQPLAQSPLGRADFNWNCSKLQANVDPTLSLHPPSQHPPSPNSSLNLGSVFALSLFHQNQTPCRQSRPPIVALPGC